MLRGPLIHPEILAALASAGHGSTVLISDANYAHGPRCGPNGIVVYANFAPGLVRAADVLACVASTVPIEAAAVMKPMATGPYAMDSDPPVWNDYRRVLRDCADFADPFREIERFEFYDVATSEDLCLTIATGETALYANILLTIGAVMPDQDASFSSTNEP